MSVLKTVKRVLGVKQEASPAPPPLFQCGNNKCGRDLLDPEKYSYRDPYNRWGREPDSASLISFLQDYARNATGGVWFRCSCGWYTLVKAGERRDAFAAVSN